MRLFFLQLVLKKVGYVLIYAYLHANEFPLVQFENACLFDQLTVTSVKKSHWTVMSPIVKKVCDLNNAETYVWHKLIANTATAYHVVEVVLVNFFITGFVTVC
jgi:hypothetical protein